MNFKSSRSLSLFCVLFSVCFFKLRGCLSWSFVYDMLLLFFCLVFAFLLFGLAHGKDWEAKNKSWKGVCCWNVWLIPFSFPSPLLRMERSSEKLAIYILFLSVCALFFFRDARLCFIIWVETSREDSLGASLCLSFDLYRDFYLDAVVPSLLSYCKFRWTISKFSTS